MPRDPVNVRGTRVSPGDTREHYREKLARITLDSMVQFVGLLDAQGTVLEINQVALDAVGIRLADVEGKPFWTTFWWQVSEEIRATLRGAIERAAAGEFVRWDTEIFGRAGGKETIIIDASLAPVTDEHGNVVFITAEGRDITEKKAHEREIARQREELAKLDVLKTQFFANISHEFRTPLTLMLGPLEDALGSVPGTLPETVTTGLSIAHRNALRLLKLVNTMLDFSRIEAGRIEASYQAVDLPRLTAELASNFESLCVKAGLRCKVDCPPWEVAEPAYVDRDMWEKIVLNLMSNAFKFTLQGEIEVRLEAAQGEARLTVRDTGVGIPPEELPRMFERFHRIEQSMGRTYEGTGIGLALVQELVKLHGGRIAVASAPGAGSTFTVTIPLGKAHLDPARIGGPAAAEGAASAAFVEEASRWLPDDTTESGISGGDEPERDERERPRILWADDNADMRAYVRDLLGKRFEVETVADGEAALAAARANPPVLILTDAMMPRLDGFGLLRAVRADPRLRDTAVILLSARAGEESRIEGLEAGADDYLVKPFAARELVARVEAQVKLKHLRNETWWAVREGATGLRTPVDSVPAILWVAKTDGGRSLWSRGWYDYTGQSQEASLGFEWMECVHPEDRAMAKRALLEALEKREPFSIDYRLRRHDGVYRWGLSQGRPRFERGGRFVGYAGSIVDIHERKQAELTSARLSAIVDSCDDAIISKDLNGTITSWNRSAERLFGYSAEEAIGQSILMLIPPERLEEEPQFVARLRRGERIDHFETVRMRRDGTRLHVSLTISPVKNAEGRIVGASKVARDITERVRHQREMEEANASLQRANADLQQFAYSASHDLQEPLRMVAAYSELLQARFGDKLGPVGKEYIEFAVQGAVRMENLLRDLRLYTQLSTAEAEEPAEVEAEAVLKKVLATLGVTIAQSGATVTHDVLPRVTIHEFQLEQVLQNLIVNAIRYRRDAAPEVHIGAEEDGEQWRFSVRDNGIGIEPEFKEQIFGIFKRLHSAAEYPGTGMGLAICQRIIERAGGRIWVESEPGRGSTFFFTVRGGREREIHTGEPVLDLTGRGQSGGRGTGA